MKKNIRQLIKKILATFINPWEKWRNRLDARLSVINTTKGWSVVIITGGQDLPMLEAVLASIDRELSGSPAEIIIVGPPQLKLSNNYQLPIKYFDYYDTKILKPLITLKKNIGVKLCQYDKVVLTHDYILLEPGWKHGWDAYGDKFEVAMNVLQNQDGSRYRDWIVCDYPEIGEGLLPYTVEATPYQYIGGTYFVVKRAFFLANQLNESLRWGEGEDVEWSLRIRSNTVFKFNQDSVVRCAKLKEALPDNWQANTVALNKLLTDN